MTTTKKDFESAGVGASDMAGSSMTTENDYFCATWGQLEPGQSHHLDCVAIVTKESQRCPRQHPLPSLPYVCECECLTCKRAWWAAGRPRTGPISDVKPVVFSLYAERCDHQFSTTPSMFENGSEIACLKCACLFIVVGRTDDGRPRLAPSKVVAKF